MALWHISLGNRLVCKRFGVQTPVSAQSMFDLSMQKWIKYVKFHSSLKKMFRNKIINKYKVISKVSIHFNLTQVVVETARFLQRRVCLNKNQGA